MYLYIQGKTLGVLLQNKMYRYEEYMYTYVHKYMQILQKNLRYHDKTKKNYGYEYNKDDRIICIALKRGTA